MITEDYVSFETAKLLKEKGFDDEYTNAFYDKTGNLYFIDLLSDLSKHPNNDTDIAASTLYVAMKWLREQNRIISIVHGYITNKYRIIITQSNELDITNLGNTLYCSNDYDYFSYEEACEEAIKYCLENLV